MSSPEMSDFDPDAFLNTLYPNLGVGGMTMTDPMDELFPPSTSGVGVAASSPAPSASTGNVITVTVTATTTATTSYPLCVGSRQCHCREPSSTTGGGKRPRSYQWRVNVYQV